MTSQSRGTHEYRDDPLGAGAQRITLADADPDPLARVVDLGGELGAQIAEGLHRP